MTTTKMDKDARRAARESSAGRRELPPQYASSLLLEEVLGDPFHPDSLLSFKQSMETDEREEFPQTACDSLSQWNLHHYYIPAHYGGELRSYEEMYSLLRLVARRDLTASVTHGMGYVAASTVWVGGNEDQKRGLAEFLKNNKSLAIGYHEQAHGHDFLGCELKATKVDGGYLLSGEKWVISNPIRSDAIIIYARSSPQGGARGFSLFLLEKDKLAESSFSYIQKFKTLGVRGHEVAGIRFHDCFVPEQSVIGRPGNGVDVMFKSSQITRTVFTAMSLGAADTALRVTLEFALSKKLYGDMVFSIPHTQSLLVDSFLDLLICDCVAIAACRTIHVATSQMDVMSALAKYFIPITIEKTIHTLSLALGARYYLREVHCWGVFQKMLRDCAMVRVSHLSSVINLSHLSQQIQALAKYRAKADLVNDRELRSRLKSIFALQEPAPDFDPKNLSLYNHGRDDVLQGLSSSLADLRDLRREPGIAPDLLETIVSLVEDVIEEANALDRLLTDEKVKKDPTFTKSPENFELANRYSILNAAAACAHMWIYNRETLGDFFAEGEWLALCLDRLMRTFQPHRAISPRPYAGKVAQEMVRRYKEGRLFSVIELQLART